MLSPSFVGILPTQALALSGRMVVTGGNGTHINVEHGGFDACITHLTIEEEFEMTSDRGRGGSPSGCVCCGLDFCFVFYAVDVVVFSCTDILRIYIRSIL